MKKVVVVLIVAFVLIQFFRIDKTNPALTPKMDFLNIKNTPSTTAAIIKTSCYDCHSNESKYPWYANVQPIAWVLKHHIDEGRKELNFSTFAVYNIVQQAHKLEDAAELVEREEMPLDSYIIGHNDANLSVTERQELVHYFRTMSAEIRLLNDLPKPTEKSDFKSK